MIYKWRSCLLTANLSMYERMMKSIISGATTATRLFCPYSICSFIFPSKQPCSVSFFSVNFTCLQTVASVQNADQTFFSSPSGSGNSYNDISSSSPVAADPANNEGYLVIIWTLNILGRFKQWNISLNYCTYTIEYAELR